MLTVPSIEGQK